MDEGSSYFTNEDRKLITQMDVKLGIVINDVSDLKRNFAGRIEMLEREKASRAEVKEMIKTTVEESLLREKNLADQVGLLKKVVYTCVGAVLLAIIGAAMNALLKSQT